ncbi:NAD(P)/FAD-dependent oxidoreductase [Clostridium thermarum]|uniref:NAD(P)/FAD-dependent oxidoreductase n=1 Tax=Clostridium thermarum TaxID=1716543 RepID=UPI00111DB0D2|nr:NAD(P)/FAD-dependent oxidoreductase [Clostridium thermarum]
MKHQILVLGGGAAGITAAITAKDYGADVAIIEGTDRIGKKILTTGNGRCNISNNTIDSTLQTYIERKKTGEPHYPIPYHSNNTDFFLPVLREFTVSDTVDLFAMLGLPLTTLEGGKMYPLSLQASSVLDIFRMALEERNIPVYTGNKVSDIKPFKSGFKVTAKSSEGDIVYQCERLILCTGGKSAAATGSDGSGYSLAKALGHRILPIHPALVQLKLDYKNLKALSGIKFDGFAEIIVEGEVLRKEFGEILFTDYGISGPPILQLSRIASVNLEGGKKVEIRINMFPNLDAYDLDNFIENHKALFGHRSLMNAFIGIINKKLIPIILKESGIVNIHKPLWEVSWKEKKSLLEHLQSWKFVVCGTNSFANAQVTAGGVDTTEVDSRTLQSKLHKNLYFAGEILDVDGDCGGYNLQWAWSSGVVAARNCVK